MLIGKESNIMTIEGVLIIALLVLLFALAFYLAGVLAAISRWR